jgi:hypothetical protein
MPAGTPARSTPQLDLMRRLKVRDSQHGQLSMPFLEDEERERLDRILDASVEHGITGKVERRAHDFLVQLGERDAAIRFLTDEERQQVGVLTKLEAPGTGSKKKQKPAPKKRAMSGGEFLVSIGVVAAVAVAAYLIYHNPATNGSAIWVGVWGVIFGGGFIGDTRRRSSTEDGSVSIPEGFLAAVIWGIAATAVVLLGGHQLSPGWASFLGFIGAGMIGRSVLKIQSDDDDDWDDWD